MPNIAKVLIFVFTYSLACSDNRSEEKPNAKNKDTLVDPHATKSEPDKGASKEEPEPAVARQESPETYPGSEFFKIYESIETFTNPDGCQIPEQLSEPVHPVFKISRGFSTGGAGLAKCLNEDCSDAALSGKYFFPEFKDDSWQGKGTATANGSTEECNLSHTENTLRKEKDRIIIISRKYAGTVEVEEGHACNTKLTDSPEPYFSQLTCVEVQKIVAKEQE